MHSGAFEVAGDGHLGDAGFFGDVAGRALLLEVLLAQPVLVESDGLARDLVGCDAVSGGRSAQ